jgi:hypothetical protein
LKKVQAVRCGRRGSQRFYRQLNGILLGNIDGETGSDDWLGAEALEDGAHPSDLASDLDARHVKGLGASSCRVRSAESNDEKRDARQNDELHGNLQSLWNVISVGGSDQNGPAKAGHYVGM